MIVLLQIGCLYGKQQFKEKEFTDFERLVRKLTGFSFVMLLNVGLLFIFTQYVASLSPVPAESDFLRVCYFTSWAQKRGDVGKFLPESYEPGLCTHLVVAFVGMTPDFTVQPLEGDTLLNSTYDRVVALKKAQPDLKVLLSFGGYVFSQDMAFQMQIMVGNTRHRETFIDSMLNLLLAYNFDGLDVAWLYPNNKVHFSFFMREMKLIFEKNNLILTATVSGVPAVISKAYDPATMIPAVDYINIIAYDFHGPWDKETGHHSPLHDRNDEKLSVSTAVKTWMASGFPASKIIVGLASYGRGWTLTDGENRGVGAKVNGPSPGALYTRTPGVIAYYEMCDLFAYGAEEKYDEESAFAVLNDLWFSYESEKSLKAKLSWIRQVECAGVSVWSLDFDDFRGTCSDGSQKFPLIKLLQASPAELEDKMTTTQTPAEEPKQKQNEEVLTDPTKKPDQ